jgi:serine/threonine protein kinase
MAGTTALAGNLVYLAHFKSFTAVLWRTRTTMDAVDLAENRLTLGVIDREYTLVGCIGIGAFGSVFLARKDSGRQVALKVMPMDTSDDEEYESFLRVRFSEKRYKYCALHLLVSSLFVYVCGQ